MGWFGKDKAISASANLVEKTGTALDALFTSDEERDAADIVKRKIAQQPEAWAHQLNLINAQSSSWFNSGWRPGLGWVCVVAAFFFFIPQYLMAAIVWMKAVAAVDWSAANATFPAYPVSDAALWQLVTLLLGGSTVRAVEKYLGTAKH